MPEDEKNKELKQLSQLWSDRIKAIRHTVKTDAQGACTSTPLPVSSDADLFVGEVHAALSDTASIDPFQAGERTPEFSVNGASSPKQQRVLSLLTKLLVAGGILLLLVLVSYGLLNNPLRSQVAASSSTAPATFTQSGQNQPQEPVSRVNTNILLDDNHPVSLKIAQAYDQQGQHDYAIAVYEKMLENNTENQELHDFLTLSIVLCQDHLGSSEQMELAMKSVLKSRSPLVRVLANYHLCLQEMRHQQYLSARQRAYQAIALLDVVTPELTEIKQLRRNLHFIAAEAISHQVLMLSNQDECLPSYLWPDFETESSLLKDVDDQTLKTIIESGTSKLMQASVGPILEQGQQSTIRSWRIICNGASVNELLSRFSAKANCDVRWAQGTGKTSFFSRPVHLYLADATDEEFAVITAGSVGLTAEIDDNDTIVINDPGIDSYMSEQLSSLRKEAISSWQRFLLEYDQDPLLGNVHFVLGLLKSGHLDKTEATAEFKMVAQRFYASPLAPDALVNSADLKRQLYDYSGAYNDLKDVVEQYPDCQAIDRAYLSLGEVAVWLNKPEEAARVYSKVYHLNDAVDVRTEAALAAGRIYYQQQDYENAETWLSRYVRLETDNTRREYAQACLILGESWIELNKDELACDALQKSLHGKLSQEEYVRAVTHLLENYVRQGQYVHAFDIMNNIASRQYPQDAAVSLLILRSRALRQMGLIDNAVSILSDREEYLINNELKAQIAYEISECYMEQERFQLAYKKLMQTLQWAESGPLVQKSLLLTAKAAVKLKLDDEALKVCTELLNLSPDESIEKEALRLVASIYDRQNNYDRAALVLMRQW